MLLVMKSSVAFCILGVAVLASFAHGQVCRDINSDCRQWSGYCQKWKDYMKKYCAKTCNLCGGGGGGGGGDGGNGGGGGGGGGSGKCGYKPSTRIVGGTEAPQGAWPWQAQITTPNSNRPFCGGTLVHRQWVMTAAHCVSRDSPSSIRVRLGAHKYDGNVGTEQNIPIERIVTHYSYKKPYGMAHDIAMLKLSRPAQINRAVGMACMPGSSGRVPDGKRCWVTGFGRLSSGGSSPKVLMQVSVPIVQQTKCQRAYGSIHDSMICAGLDQGGKDSCQGDSGGPMVCEQNGKFYIEGVVSWGHGCASPGKYGVYSRVRYLMGWVENTMNRY